MLDKIRGVRFSIRYKLVVLFLLVTLIPLGVATVLARNNAESALLETGRTNQEARAQNTTRVIDEYLTAHLSDVTVTAGLTDLRELAQRPTEAARIERARSLLTSMQKKDSAYESFSVLTPDGTVLASSLREEEGSNAAGRPAFQAAMFGRATISDAIMSAATKRPALELIAP